MVLYARMHVTLRAPLLVAAGVVLHADDQPLVGQRLLDHLSVGVELVGDSRAETARSVRRAVVTLFARWGS